MFRAHPCAAGYEKDQNAREGLGRSRGGFTNKVHRVVDALGEVLRFSLTLGQRYDITQATILLQGFENTNIIADKRYDSNALIDQIQEQKCVPIIPSRSNRKYPENMMNIYIKNGTWWNTFLTKSNTSGASSHALIKKPLPLLDS